MKQIVSLSGGKDSTCMLLMMLEKGEQIDDIVFFDWGMEFSQMYEHLEKLEDYIQQPITRLYPPHSFEYYMFDYLKIKGAGKGTKGYGWAHWQGKWCSRIKFQAINKYCGSAIQCVGLAYEERFRRRRRDDRRYPLLEWGVHSLVARDYCYSKDFDYGGLYKIFGRVSCWNCPFQDLRRVRDNFPDLWQKLLEMNAKSPYPHPQKQLIDFIPRG